ncbi:MAG: BspA family leucine-rich repeat surface protein [Flavobacteriaceae bacterium]|nr:BspA family leucine-rich repeat surface protein [Flavobacteriaceae bacterium]MCY4267979.1 BspA family leucine-rich repeat surface protein [Flavobacteriaceae bacterium]
MDNLRNLFRGESDFNGAIASWDVRGVTTMGKMFQGASSFNQDIGPWDVSQATNMRQMFENARVFEQNLSHWVVDQVTDCHHFATNASLPASFLPDFTSYTLVEKEEEEETEAYNPLPQTKDYRGTQIPIEDTCPPLPIKHSNGITVIINPIIQNPSEYVGQKATVDGTLYTIVDNASLKTLVAADNTDAKCTTLVTDMSALFATKTSFNQDIGNWDVSNMFQIFFNATAFNQDIGDWDVSSMTDMSLMFEGATSFNQDIGEWNVGLVTNMGRIFRLANSFNQDINGWDVDQVTGCLLATCVLNSNKQPDFLNCNQRCN